jgi:hypothetical protein
MSAGFRNVMKIEDVKIIYRGDRSGVVRALNESSESIKIMLMQI